MRPHTMTLTILVLLVLGSTGAEATPAFSRQINADCRTCHFQNMHSLNRFGRAFKQNAYQESEKMRAERMRRAHRDGAKRKPGRPGL